MNSGNNPDLDQDEQDRLEEERRDQELRDRQQQSIRDELGQMPGGGEFDPGGEGKDPVIINK